VVLGRPGRALERRRQITGIQRELGATCGILSTPVRSQIPGSFAGFPGFDRRFFGFVRRFSGFVRRFFGRNESVYDHHERLWRTRRRRLWQM